MVTKRIWSGCGGPAALERGQCRGWAVPGLTPKHHFLPPARYLRGETAGKNTSSHQSSHFLLLQESWSAAIDITDHFLPGKNHLSAETLPFPPLIPHWQDFLLYTKSFPHPQALSNISPRCYRRSRNRIRVTKLEICSSNRARRLQVNEINE